MKCSTLQLQALTSLCTFDQFRGPNTLKRVPSIEDPQDSSSYHQWLHLLFSPLQYCMENAKGARKLLRTEPPGVRALGRVAS